MSDALLGRDARILERGYRRYPGEREGEGHAVRSVIAYTLRRVLGLRRPARSKILPLMAIVFAYLPAIVFVGVVALLGRFGARQQVRQIVPQYHDYYRFIISAIVLFVAFAAPEALCPDRRSRVLSLYLASPLTRMTYLVAKAAAVGVILAAVTVGPPLLLLLGLVTQSAGPDGPVALVTVVVRILGSGLLLAALFTALSMGIASLTDRRAVAAAATVFVIIGSGTLAGTLLSAVHAPHDVVVLSLTESAIELVRRIYGQRGSVPQVDTLVLAAGNAAWTLGLGAIAVLRYQRLQVTR